MAAKKKPADKKPHGRPTLFKEEYTDQLLEYFSAATPYEERTVLDKNGDEKIITVPGKFPTLARFATMVGVTRDTLYEWSTGTNDNGELKHASFSYAYKRAKDYQEALLCEGTIANVFNAPFSIFTAKNILGWKDKTEVDQTLNATVESTVTTASQESIAALEEKIAKKRAAASGD